MIPEGYLTPNLDLFECKAHMTVLIACHKVSPKYKPFSDVVNCPNNAHYNKRTFLIIHYTQQSCFFSLFLRMVSQSFFYVS